MLKFNWLGDENAFSNSRIIKTQLIHSRVTASSSATNKKKEVMSLLTLHGQSALHAVNTAVWVEWKHHHLLYKFTVQFHRKWQIKRIECKHTRSTATILPCLGWQSIVLEHFLGRWNHQIRPCVSNGHSESSFAPLIGVSFEHKRSPTLVLFY